MRDILNTFSKHVSDVDRLIIFDQEVMQIAISAVEDLHKRLLKQRIDNEQLNGARVLQILKDIRRNDSLKPRFSLIFNQAIVLLVSYFGSAVEDIFCFAVTAGLRHNFSSRLLKEDIKLTVAELLEVIAHSDEAIAELLIEKKDLSFQDMQAIQRAFRDYVGVEIEKDNIVNNIILAQACRHVIVHAGGEVTSKFLRQISGAIPRDIKNGLTEETTIQFSEDEVRDVAKSMKSYLTSLVEKTEKVLAHVS